MTTLPSSWDTLRKQIRSTELSLDSKLTVYSGLASTILQSQSQTASSPYTSISIDPNRNPNGSGDQMEEAIQLENQSKDLEGEIELLMDQLSSSHQTLSSQLHSDPTLPPSSSQVHTLQRHEEILQDYSRDYRRSKINVSRALDKRLLVGRVRGDIDAHKAQYASNTDSLLAERGRLDNSHRMLDDTLNQAYSTRQDLNSQSSQLSAISGRLGSTLQQLPGLNGILNMISRRRRRDSIIMGGVIGTLTVLLLMFMSR